MENQDFEDETSSPDQMSDALHPRIQQLLDQPSYTQRSPEWFEQRKHYLTASSVAAALNIKPYASFKGNPRLELMQKLKAGNQFTEHSFITTVKTNMMVT